MADDKKIPKQKQPKEEKQVKEPKVTIKDVAETLKDANKEINETLSRNTNVLKEIGEVLKSQNVNLKSIDVNSTTQTKLDELSKRDDYQIEQKEDANFVLLKEQNELLNQILNAIGKSESDIKKKEKDSGGDGISGFEGLLMGIFGPKILKAAKLVFSKIGSVLEFLFITPFKKIFGKAGVKLFAKRLLKWVAAPIMALFAVIDFSEGWKDAEKITGRKGWGAKFQGGFSKVLSGLTLGLIKPKTISKGIDFLYKFLKDKVVMPIVRFVIKLPQMIIDLFKKYFNLETFYAIINKLKEIPIIGDIFSKMSEAFNYLTNKFQTYIINPIKSFIDLIREKMAIIGQKFYSFASDMKNVLVQPLEWVRKQINDAIGNFFGEKVGSLESYQGMGIVSELSPSPIFKDLYNLDKSGLLEKKPANPPMKEGIKVNNNINTFNSNTVNNRMVDMSTFSDDFANMSPIFNFGLGTV